MILSVVIRMIKTNLGRRRSYLSRFQSWLWPVLTPLGLLQTEQDSSCKVQHTFLLLNSTAVVHISSCTAAVYYIYKIYVFISTYYRRSGPCTATVHISSCTMAVYIYSFLYYYRRSGRCTAVVHISVVVCIFLYFYIAIFL